MHNEKSYFGTQNGSLATCHIGVVMTESSVSLHSSPYSVAAPLSAGTVGRQRSFINFLWSEGLKPSEIYRRMKVQYADSCVTCTCLDLWKNICGGPQVCR